MFRRLSLFRCRYAAVAVIAVSIGVTIYTSTFLSVRANRWKVQIETFLGKNVFDNHRLPWNSYFMADVSTDAAAVMPVLDVNMSALKYKVRGRKECQDVAENPRSYWRSQNFNGSLNTSEVDIARMNLAFGCGTLYEDFFAKPPIPWFYPFEKFYLSEPPLVNIDSVTNESLSVITSFNSSLQFKAGDIAAFKIELKNNSGLRKEKGGDHIRAWLVEESTKSYMAAKVVDLNNGTYIASAPLLWAGKLRLHVAVPYPREYIRALLYAHRVIKAFRPIAGVFKKNAASEATPCYHTPVVLGFDANELCNLTDVNGSPWFCGHPIKHQLGCSDYVGSVVVGTNDNPYPVTDAEMEILRRSCREPRIRKIPNNFELNVLSRESAEKLPCNKVLPQTTWNQEIPTGYLSKSIWYPRLCNITQTNIDKCFQNKQILIYGDSNGRGHYNHLVRYSKCNEAKKALTKHWHKPLLCVHKGNNFSMSWDPHTNPFMSGPHLADLDSLIATSKAIDQISAHGHFLIILNHYYHLTTSHISAADLMFRSIKDALVRLFQRNPNVQVVVQGPHIAWYGWPEHYAAGDMLGKYIMDLQHEVFQDIKDKVVFISPWDMSIATANWDYHPRTIKCITTSIVGFMCGR